MRKSILFLNSLLLSAALLAPLAMQAQDRDHDRDKQRVYDRIHKQYHTWNNDEDQAYRQ